MAFIKQIKVGNNTYDIHKKVTVTIAAADWTAATIDKTVSGMTVNDIVVVSPAPSSITGARNSVVYCSAIKAGALSFTYSVAVPTTALTFNVLWVQAATTDTDKGAIINTVMGGKIPTGTLNVNSTLSNYDTYLNNVRYINLGAGSLNVSGSAISSVSGSGSVNPGTNTISKNSATNVSTGTVTTTKPTSGVYVAVDAATAQGSGNINISASGTAKAGVTTAGYVHNETASSTISKSGTASVTVPAKSAATTYIPINAGTIDVTDKTVNPNALTGTWDATNEKYVVSQAKKTGETMQSTVTTAGYVSSTVGTKNTGALTINAPANLEIAKATFAVSGNSVKSNTAGYIPANTNVGAVSTVARASTTISTAANTTDAKLTVTASNNQGTGYVTGSNETASDTITLSVSGATVTATSGNDSTKKVSKSVASGTAGTPKATKGTVSNHSIAVTPSVTNTTGYITGGTKSGTAVTVAASELVSGNKALSSSASDQTNIDVTNYKTVSISKMASTNVVEIAGSVNASNNTYTQGKVTVEDAGYISAGDKVSGASFANTATPNVTYKDISSTTAAPVLVSNNYLYINKGYTDNVKISLAKLVPDGASAALASDKILSGYSAYDNDGNLIAGNIPTITPAFDGGGLSGNNIGGSQTKGSVTISESGTFFADAAKTNFGVTTTKPSGADGTNYLTVHEAHSTASGKATGSTKITRGAVLYNGEATGYVDQADNTQALASGSKTVSASITVTPSVTDNFEPYYIPIVTPAFDGGALSATNSTTDTGALSGGALTAGAGEVSIITEPEVTLSVSGTAVSSTSQKNFGVTTTKPSGTDGTNYITLDPSVSVTTIGKMKGRGSVTRGTVNRAKFSSTVTRGAVLYKEAKHGAVNIAANTQALASESTTVSLAAGSIASASGTSNWSEPADITPIIVAADTNYYIPVSAASASATAGTATATAGTTSVSGLTAGTYQTTATSGYTYKITATGGSASATGGSASASVSKGVTSGATKSATGASTGTKTGASATIYLVKATITNNTSGGNSPETINRGKQIKIGAGYNPSDLYYIAEAAPTLSGNAATDDVLSGKKFYSNSYTIQTGTMANNGSTGGTISTKAGTVSIPAGYTTGGSVSINTTEQNKIVAGNIKSGVTILGVAGTYTNDATATAANILYDKTAYVNGAKISGTMTNRGAVNPAALNPGGSYTIPAGYHNGNGKVTARALINQAKSPTEITVGTAITPDSGKDGLSSVTIPSNATITVGEENKLNIIVPCMSSPIVTYDSTSNEGGESTQLNATVGGGTLNTINVKDGATTNVNVYNTGILNINRVSGTVHSDDLVASNIRRGANILGVVGTYAASSTASDIYKAQYAGNISSGWSIYWYSSEGNMGSNWDFTEPLSTPIPQGASVRLKYNDFGPNASSGGGFRVSLVSASGTEQIIASPSAYTAANGPHTSSPITSNIVATKIKVEKFSGAGETVSTYQLLAVEVYVNVPSGYYGVTAASGGSTLADVSSYQYMAVKKATLGKTYTPSTSTQYVKVNGEGWVKTSDTVATIKPISTETQTVNLSLASGNQTVHANSDKYMTSVIINKPSTLVAGNIKSGVNIAGVTGTYSAPPAADPAVKFLGLYLYTQRGSGSNIAVLENVTGCQFAGVNHIFGEGAYVGCFGLFAFKGTPTTKPCLFNANGVVMGESSAVPLSDLLNDPYADRNVSLYNLLDGITKYEQNINYNQIYLAPMILDTSVSTWGPSSPYYWQASGIGDSSSTYVYIKNLGSKCMSLNYND